jgi:hypothetical protein
MGGKAENLKIDPIVNVTFHPAPVDPSLYNLSCRLRYTYSYLEKAYYNTRELRELPQTSIRLESNETIPSQFHSPFTLKCYMFIRL